MSQRRNRKLGRKLQAERKRVARMKRTTEVHGTLVAKANELALEHHRMALVLACLVQRAGGEIRIPHAEIDTLNTNGHIETPHEKDVLVFRYSQTAPAAPAPANEA